MAGDRGSVAVLLGYTDEAFSQTISSMDPQALMDTISNLQQEMKSEQDSFNALSQQLNGLRDKRTYQYKEISKNLMASQSRLTLLMNRSMQCFSKQSSKTQTQTLGRKVPTSQPSQNKGLSATQGTATLPRQEPKANQLSSNSFHSKTAPFQKENAVTVKLASAHQKKQSSEPVGTRVNLSVSQKPMENQLAPNLTHNLIKDSSQENHVTANSSKFTTNNANSNISTKSSKSEHYADSTKDLNHSGSVTKNGDQVTNPETKKTVYRIPQVSALRQTFEQKEPDDVAHRSKSFDNLAQRKETRLTSNIKQKNQIQDSSKSESKQTFRSTVQVSSQSNPNTSNSVSFNGVSKSKSVSNDIYKSEIPKFKPNSVNKNILVTYKSDVPTVQNNKERVNHRTSSQRMSNEVTVGTSSDQTDALPVTSIDDIIINERPAPVETSRPRSKSQPLHITSVMSKSREESSGKPDLKQPPETVNSSSLLEARLQRMRQGPLVTRSRPGQPEAPSGRMSLGGTEFGAGGLGMRSSILEKSAKDRLSIGPWNPFAEEKKNVSYGSSSSRFRSREIPTAAKSYAPEVPQFQQVGVSSDLMRVRELLKGRGYASVAEENQPPETNTVTSRRESLMKRQPAVATSYSVFKSSGDEEPSSLGEERRFARPSVLSSMSTNGHMNGAPQFLSSRHSILSSPTFPTSPTFSTSPTFPTSSTYATSPTYLSSPTFPTSVTESYVDDSNGADLQKRQEIQSQFEALGGSIDAQTAGALDRISRVRKFLEESKRASEARMSVPTKNKYQINNTILQSDESSAGETRDTEINVSTGVSIQENVDNSYPSRFARSEEARFQNDSSMFTAGLDNHSVTLQHDDIRSRFQLQSNEPRGSSVRDISEFSNFPPRYIPMKREVNHSENSLFRPINVDGFDRMHQNRIGSVEEEIPEPENSNFNSNTLPRAKTPRSGAGNSKDSSDTKSSRTSSLFRPTKSTAAKAVPETKPKPTKNAAKKTGKKLPQIAMFENMGQQNKPAEKTFKKVPKAKNVDSSRDKTVQKMLFGKSSGDQVDGSDVISEDGKSQESAELVNISQTKGDSAFSKDAFEKSSKPCTPSPRSKTPKPSRDSPHSKPGRNSQSSRSSSSDKSGQFSPGARRKSLADTSNKSRSRRSSPERPRRKSISEQPSNNAAFARRNSIKGSDTTRIQDKVTISSRNKMVDKARSRSKPDLREISSPREERSPSKPIFRRSKSVGKQESFDSTSVEGKQNQSRKPTKDSKAQNTQEGKKSGPYGTGWNSQSKTSPSKQKSDVVQRAVAKLSNTSDTSNKGEKTKNQSDNERKDSNKPVGGWEFIYVGPKERKSDETKRLVDLSREIRGVDLEPEEPDTIPIGPGVIRQVLDQFKRPSVPEQNSTKSETPTNLPAPDVTVNGNNETYTSKTSDLLDRVAQLKQSIKEGHKAALNAFQEDPEMTELSNRHVSSKIRDDGEVSEMGGAPVYGLPSFKLNLNELPSKSKQTDHANEDNLLSARSMDSESTDYDSAVEAQIESSTTQLVLSVEEDSMSEYNSAAETFGSEAEENEANNNKFYEKLHQMEINAENTDDDFVVTTPKGDENFDYNLIAFDVESTTPIAPTISQPDFSDPNNVDHLLFDFDPVPVISDHASTTPAAGILPCTLGDGIHKKDNVIEIINTTLLHGPANDSVMESIYDKPLSSSFADLADLVINTDEIKCESHDVEEIKGEPVLYTQMQGYDNPAFGSDEESEQDNTLTDEINVTVPGSVTHNADNIKDDLKLSDPVIPESSNLLEYREVGHESIDMSQSENGVSVPVQLNKSELLSGDSNSEHSVVESGVLPEPCLAKPVFNSMPEDKFTRSSRIINSEKADALLPQSSDTNDELIQALSVEMPERSSLAEDDYSDEGKISNGYSSIVMPRKDDREDSACYKPNTVDSCKLITGEVIFQPANDSVNMLTKPESEAGECSPAPSSPVTKVRMCSTETEGGSSDGERERFQSESDYTESSEVRSSSLGSSSTAVNEQQSPQIQGSGRKKRNRSESKKRRKRKHIEKAAALKEAGTLNSQSDPSSPQELKRSGSGKHSGRKAKGAMLVTNLLVLDMGLSAPEPDQSGEEPGAVFLPLKSTLSGSEDSLFDDAGSIADDERESNIEEVQNAEENISVDRDDQPYLTPEAVSPEDEVPQPGFVKNNIFLLNDKLSDSTECELPQNDEPAKETDVTICAMFKRTLGLLTRRQTEKINEEKTNTLVASPTGCENVSVPEKVPGLSIEEEIRSTIQLVNDQPHVCSMPIVDTGPLSGNYIGPSEPSCRNSSNLMEGNASQVISSEICNETVVTETNLNDFYNGFNDKESGNLHGEAEMRELCSPKLFRENSQSFIFHNKFIQDDIVTKAAQPTRSEGKILGRRHRNFSPSHTNTTSSASQRDDDLHPPMCQETEGRITPNSGSMVHEQDLSPTSRKSKFSRRFVKDNLFFTTDSGHKKKDKSERVELNPIQNVLAPVGGEKTISGSFGKALRASFRKLTHNKSFRRSKPKSATSTQDLSFDATVTEVQSQTGSMLSSLGNSTPCLFDESYAASYTGSTEVPGENTLPHTIDGVPIDDEQDLVQERTHLTSWDPTPLLKELYTVRLMDETTEDLSHRFISMEGVMEKLPIGKRKSTLLKTWKRRYFKAADGWLHYYENNNYDKPCHSFQLMGGSIEVLDSRIMGIDDGRGHYLMVRCPSPNDFENWRVSLESQTTDNVKAVHVRPALHSPPNPAKKVVIIDIGSTSVRAGILGKEASLPQVFFPTVVAEKMATREYIVGFDAYRPEIRNQSTLHFPIRPSVKVDKGKSLPFNIDMRMMPYIFDKVFSDLKVDSKSYWVLLSTPQMLADKLKAEIMDVLTKRCGVQGVCIAPQALLAMYSYKATSGIIVDVGERIDILPISDGYIVEGGMTRQPFGGEKVADSLKQYLTRLQYHFFTEVERLIIRLVMEKTLYVARDIKEETRQFQQSPEKISAMVSLKNYNLPEGTYTDVVHRESRFKSTEGFFDTNLWGTDFPNLHKLVHKAIVECPMDNRREMCRSIFLSGGVTMLPGFAERLEMEISKLVPAGLTVQVHASPQRYHAAFIGGCTLAAQELFQQNCITREDWIKNGVKELKRWQIPS